MLKLAKKQFAEFSKRHHNIDMPVLLFCDNLDAHCWDDVLKVFADVDMFALFLVPGGTGFYAAH
jgi:hypothetical protein